MSENAAEDARLDALWEAEMRRYCPRCDRLSHKCDCAEHDMDLMDAWDECAAYWQTERRNATLEAENTSHYRWSRYTSSLREAIEAYNDD